MLDKKINWGNNKMIGKCINEYFKKIKNNGIV